MAPNKDYLWAVVNTGFHRPGPLNDRNFVSIREPASVPRRTVLNGVGYYSIVVICLGTLVGS